MASPKTPEFPEASLPPLSATKKEVFQNKTNGPVIMMPTHRSYIDFLICSYIFLSYNIPLPHIAAGEDFLNMFLVRNLFRHSGAFFIRREFKDDEL